ncbi:MAG: hypothetical protein ACRENZ_03130 [Thermodesulfobacteriota bacterium]
MPKIKKSSVIIIREGDGTGGCICCSGGMGDYGKKDHSYEGIRKIVNECGRLHREIRERYGEDEVEITQIEPRTFIYLIPKVLKDLIKFNRSLISSYRTILMLYPLPTVIVNGKPIGKGNVPTIKEVLKEITI